MPLPLYYHKQAAMKAIIIGAGIGGLTTAIALQQRGIDYEIFDAAPECKPVGAGILLGSNAMQVYKKLGLAKALGERAVYHTKNISEALQQYQSGRMPRVKMIVKTSLRMARLTNMSGRLLTWLRNTAVRSVPASVAKRQLTELYDAKL